jgi:hypothetical protein
MHVKALSGIIDDEINRSTPSAGNIEVRHVDSCQILREIPSGMMIFVLQRGDHEANKWVTVKGSNIWASELLFSSQR